MNFNKAEFVRSYGEYSQLPLPTGWSLLLRGGQMWGNHRL